MSIHDLCVPLRNEFFDFFNFFFEFLNFEFDFLGFDLFFSVICVRVRVRV